ncbi:MAG TPA: hypothetical protein VKU19_23275 [Bryobacteraceae bacterium]|nr:hypothetical protein [Bryobacteraceae bacterium]
MVRGIAAKEPLGIEEDGKEAGVPERVPAERVLASDGRRSAGLRRRWFAGVAAGFDGIDWETALPRAEDFGRRWRLAVLIYQE